ncbi:hypothetical protein [Furfurilactobacillus siliginis]|uniref:Bacteriocin immunity protein n=1 Tax=Furfurilactobacillus siliginis TaxID=348151 RepID=A0A0R2L3E9_9LACO|nr:hypothetical protein [Furfurilactobacillus siliginis]KRN96130.1 hypothetical protein IV55_GL001513 [Furfurilactobacillus siliginis]GEK27946.1 hypothetical protein LSI01_02570 [Furfurilactobacillus siliginis]
MTTSIEAVSTIRAQLHATLADPLVSQSPALVHLLSEQARRFSYPGDYGKMMRHLQGLLARYQLTTDTVPPAVTTLATMLMRQLRGYDMLLNH